MPTDSQAAAQVADVLREMASAIDDETGTKNEQVGLTAEEVADLKEVASA